MSDRADTGAAVRRELGLRDARHLSALSKLSDDIVRLFTFEKGCDLGCDRVVSPKREDRDLVAAGRNASNIDDVADRALADLQRRLGSE